MTGKKRGRPKKEPAKVGRKTKFNPKWIEQLEIIGKKGMIDSEIAALFEISLSSFYLYQLEHEEFKKGVQEAKKKADWNIKESVYKRALGYMVTETEIIEGEMGTTRKIKEKHIPGDMKAAQMWLQNREPDEWREKQNIQVENDIVFDISFNNSEDDEA